MKLARMNCEMQCAISCLSDLIGDNFLQISWVKV